MFIFECRTENVSIKCLTTSNDFAASRTAAEPMVCSVYFNIFMKGKRSIENTLKPGSNMVVLVSERGRLHSLA